MNGEFIVYVNNPKSYTKIHSTSCPWYRKANPKDPKNGRWSPICKTFKEAQDYANGQRKKDNSTCEHCKPKAKT